MYKNLIILFLIFSNSFVSAQNFQWVKGINGGFASFKRGEGIFLDGRNNVYVLGTCSGTADFDPGPKTYNLSGGPPFILKLDSHGNFLWAKSIAVYHSIKMTTDADENVYIIGIFEGKVDFDPDDSGSFYLTSEGGYDVFILKLDINGDFVWAKKFGGKDYDFGVDIALDRKGNIYTTGTYRNIVDFDPGSLTYKLTSVGDGDIFISKLDSSGNFVWVKSIGSYYFEGAQDIALDSADNIYTIGTFMGGVDFNPPNSNYLNSNGEFDVFICKMNSSGDYQWAKSVGGKLEERINSMAVDPSGNIYYTGFFEDSADFDPGSGYYYLGSQGNKDIYISKLDASGNFVWAKGMGSTNADIGFSIALDHPGNVYTTGYYGDSTDFDPGAAIFKLAADHHRKVFASKLTNSGDFVWALTLAGYTDNLGDVLTADYHGNAYYLSMYSGKTDFDPGIDTSFLTSAVNSGGDLFILKLGPCPSKVNAINGPNLICGNNKFATYSINPASGAAGYRWEVPSDAVITSGQNTTSINVTFGTISGMVAVRITNACDTNDYINVSVKIAPDPMVGFMAKQGTTICTGNSVNLAGTGALKYVWSGGISNGIDFKPSASGQFIVTGTDANGCKDADTVIISVIPKPKFTLQPRNKFISVPVASVQFMAKSDDTGITYQWQKIIGSNFTNLSNNSQFSGVDKDTLSINNGLISLNYHEFRVVITNRGCSVNSNSAFFVVEKGEVLNLTGQENFMIYPNPAIQSFTIEINNNKNFGFQMFNSFGQVVLKKQIIQSGDKIDIIWLPQGVYNIMLETEGQLLTKRIIKQ